MGCFLPAAQACIGPNAELDRKSTRLNSSHTVISYAVFCLKKKKKPRALSSICTTTTARRGSDHWQDKAMYTMTCIYENAIYSIKSSILKATKQLHYRSIV